jgi:hypothetical protein
MVGLMVRGSAAARAPSQAVGEAGGAGRGRMTRTKEPEDDKDNEGGGARGDSRAWRRMKGSRDPYALGGPTKRVDLIHF